MSTISPPVDITALQRLIGQGQLDAALSQLDRALAQDPEHADANYLAAVCHRYKNNHSQAQQHLDALKGNAIDRGRVYQEQGHLFRAQGQDAAAVAAYHSACQLNPALLASWKALQEIESARGNSAQSQQAALQVQRLQALPKALLSVTDLIGQGKLFKAEALCKQFLQTQPTHAEGMRLLADIAQRLGAMDEAEFLLESALEFSTNNTQLQIDHVQVLRRRQKFSASLAAAETLRQQHPDNPQFVSLLGIEKMQVGDYAAAVDLFNQVLERLPDDAITLTSRGHALKTWGKQAEAIDSYRQALASNPMHGEAWYALSNLKTYTFSDSEIDAMLARLADDSLAPSARMHIDFALGKAYEDQQHWQASFEHYERGNFINRQQSSYDADKMTEELLSQRDYFNSDNIARRARAGCTDPSPIFIVGLPRAGSTLLEQILSSHSQVDGTLELPNMLTIAQRLRRQGRSNKVPDYPEVIETLGDSELQALGQRYIDETRIHRQGAPFFIDKMPNNFRHVGLIKMLLPNARIIDARRHPVGCCFSGFKQLFAEGQEFTYSLDDIAQYYNDYVTLMDHWDTEMPGAVLRVHYEEVTADLEAQVRRILDYCGLPFEENCLAFHKTARAVRTASSEQVRQPIYQSGVDQWRNYEPFLAPLINKLAPSLQHYPH